MAAAVFPQHKQWSSILLPWRSTDIFPAGFVVCEAFVLQQKICLFPQQSEAHIPVKGRWHHLFRLDFMHPCHHDVIHFRNITHCGRFSSLRMQCLKLDFLFIFSQTNFPCFRNGQSSCSSTRPICCRWTSAPWPSWRSATRDFPPSSAWTEKFLSKSNVQLIFVSNSLRLLFLILCRLVSFFSHFVNKPPFLTVSCGCLRSTKMTRRK